MEFTERDDFVHNTLYAYCRWAWLAVLTFGLLCFLVFFMAWLLTPRWDSKAYLALDPTTAPPASQFADPTRWKGERMEAAYAYQAIQILTGREMAFAVVNQFNLAEKRRLKSEDPQGSRERVQAGFERGLEATVNLVKWILRIKSEEEETDWADKAAREFHDGLFAWVTAEPVTDTDIVELVVSADSPELANAIVDFMIEELRRQLVVHAAGAGQEAVVAFEQQLADVRGMEAQAEQALQAFMDVHGGAAPGESARLKTVDRDALQSERDRLLVEEAALQGEVQRLAAGEPLVFSERLLESEVVQQLRVKLQELGLRRAVLEGELTDEHPDVQEVDRQILRAESELAGEVLMQLGTVRSELRHAEEQLVMLERELKTLSQRQLEYGRLESELLDWQSLRRELQGHIHAIRVASAAGISPLAVRLLDRMRVSPSKNPDSPIWLLVAIIALVFATGAAVVVPPFIEYWRDPVRGPLDLLAKGIAPLAVTPVSTRRPPRRWWRRSGNASTIAARWHDLAVLLTIASQEKGGPWCAVVSSAGDRADSAEVCRRMATETARMGRRVVVLTVASSPEPAGQPSLAKASEPLVHTWAQDGAVLFVTLPENFGALPTCGTQPVDWVASCDIMLLDGPEAGTRLHAYLAQRSDAAILVADSSRLSLSEVVRKGKAIVEDGCHLLGAVLVGHSSPLPRWLDRWNDRPT